MHRITKHHRNVFHASYNAVKLKFFHKEPETGIEIAPTEFDDFSSPCTVFKRSIARCQTSFPVTSSFNGRKNYAIQGIIKSSPVKKRVCFSWLLLLYYCYKIRSGPYWHLSGCESPFWSHVTRWIETLWRTCLHPGEITGEFVKYCR